MRDSLTLESEKLLFKILHFFSLLPLGETIGKKEDIKRWLLRTKKI